MAYDQNPKAYARGWYGAKVDAFVSIANALIEEGITENGKLAHELHEWVSAPDSFFNWCPDQEQAEIIESILFISPNANIAGGDEGTRWDDEDDSQYAYYAAHAFIADVMWALKRDPGPYLGPNDPE